MGQFEPFMPFGTQNVLAVILGGGFHQSVQEDVNTAEQMVAVHSN